MTKEQMIALLKDFLEYTEDVNEYALFDRTDGKEISHHEKRSAIYEYVEVNHAEINSKP